MKDNKGVYHYEICGICDGTGTTMHEAFSGGYNGSEEWYDPDFEEEVERGTYDVPCKCENGKIKVYDEVFNPEYACTECEWEGLENQLFKRKYQEYQGASYQYECLCPECASEVGEVGVGDE